MKLYTEEQVREMLMSIDTNIYISDSYIDSKIDLLTPIELPSDEEIDEESIGWWAPSAFRAGAKWVIEQIKQQDNG
jgi:hypothetical protein